MPFALTWKVEFGDCTGLVDITSYVMSLNITSDATLGKMGRSSAAVTINNIGGQFTPNGTGTYGSVDWFRQALVITSTSGVNTGTSFVGIISNVENNDLSAKEAYFSVQALDYASIAGRATAKNAGGGETSLHTEIENVIDCNFPFGGNQLSRTTMGSNTNTRCNFAFTRVEGNGTGSSLASAADNWAPRTPFISAPFYLGDAINNTALAGFPSTFYATDYTRTSSLWSWNYDFQYVGNRSTRANTFVFKGDGTALTSGQLPFDQTHIGFQTDVLINDANVGTYEVSDTNSMTKYGSRTVSYSNPGNSNVSDNLIAATNWVNRYSTIRYLTDSISVDYSSLRGAAVDDGVAMLQFMYLLWPAYSLWNRVDITIKGSGQSASSSYKTKSIKTVINATPSDTSVTVSLVSLVDNSTFILDDATFGVLDQDHLG